MASSALLFGGCAADSNRGEPGCDPDNVRVLYSGIASRAICGTGEKVNSIVTPDDGKSFSLTESEGQDKGDYLGPFVMLGLASVIVGAGYYGARNASSDGMYHETNRLKIMTTGDFNLELRKEIFEPSSHEE